jgi:hypothetical protein
MKSVPNLISYLHNFVWNFSQFLAICLSYFRPGVILIRKTLTSGAHLSAAAFRAGPACQCAVATWLRCAAPIACLKCAVGTARRCPDSPFYRAPAVRVVASPRACCPDRAAVHVRSHLPAIQGSPPLLSERRAGATVAR